MNDLARPAPPPSRTLRRDWFAGGILAASALLHAGAISTYLLTHRAEAMPPTEIPVEIVQLPPEQTAPKPEAQKPEPPKPEPPKQETPKQEPPKQAPPKQEPPNPEPPKPEPPKPRPQAQKPAPKAAPKPEQKSVAERMRDLIGPMPAQAMPSLAAGEGSALDDAVPYRQLVLSRVAKEKREGRHNGIPGHTVIAFSIGGNGEVASCKVLEPSGDPSLDAEAVAMVRRAAPYPPPPPGAARDFSFGLTFQVM